MINYQFANIDYLKYNIKLIGSISNPFAQNYKFPRKITAYFLFSYICKNDLFD